MRILAPIYSKLLKFCKNHHHRCLIRSQIPHWILVNIVLAKMWNSKFKRGWRPCQISVMELFSQRSFITDVWQSLKHASDSCVDCPASSQIEFLPLSMIDLLDLISLSIYVRRHRVSSDDTSKAVSQRCSVEKVFLKISQKFTGRCLYQSLFLIKLQGHL